jgi:hypothetical protein
MGITERVTYDTRRLASLKREIMLRRYQVDSAAVAEAILVKLAVLRRGREAIAAQPGGRTPAPDASSRPRR